MEGKLPGDIRWRMRCSKVQHALLVQQCKNAVRFQGHRHPKQQQPGQRITQAHVHI